MAYPFFDEGARLRALREQLDRPTFVLSGIGALLVRTSQKAFREEKLGNVRWKDRGETRMVPNWPAVIVDFARGKSAPPERRFAPRPVLSDQGLLRRSFAWRLVDRNTVEEGSVMAYADALHAGLPTLTEVVSRAVQERLWAWMKKTKATASKAFIDKSVAAQRAKAARSDPEVKRLTEALKANRRTKIPRGKAGKPYREHRARLKAQLDAAKLRAAGQAAARIHTGSKSAEKRHAAAKMPGLARVESLRWLLNKALTGRRLKVQHPARPMVGVPPELIKEVEQLYGISIRKAS